MERPLWKAEGKAAVASRCILWRSRQSNAWRCHNRNQQWAAWRRLIQQWDACRRRNGHTATFEAAAALGEVKATAAIPEAQFVALHLFRPMCLWRPI